MKNRMLYKDVVIIGAGISGIGAGIFLKNKNINNFVLLEKSNELGGTWRDNTYPGVAVDIPTVSYSFSFEPNPNWSRFFAPGQEIQAYVKHCAEKYNIKPHINYNQHVKKIVFDTGENMWLVHLADEQVLKARYVISATGILNQPVRPNIEGIDSFKGKMIHTARWDHDYDINDKKVAVIGTGASAVQLVPAIADKVKQLKVYQRTPIWVVPKKEREFDEQAQERFKKWPVTQSVIRFLTDLRIQSETWCILNYRRFPFVTKFVEKELAKYLASQVADPELRKKLTPHYGFGCKRPSLSNTYLKTFNKQNVRLITEGIQKITTKGIVTNDGEEHELDTIILGTGFKTFEPGNSPSYTVQGLQGLDLGQFWEQNRYQAYRGVSVPNFPNYFMTFGPYTGGFNWFSMLESQLRYIVRCIVKANKKGATYVEVSQKAHDKDFQATLKKSKESVFQSSYCLSANSYYFDAKGDASLPSVISPFRRWIITKFAGHRGFLFK